MKYTDEAWLKEQMAALFAIDPSIVPDTNAQAQLERLKRLSPEKLAARMPAWYKMHQARCAGSDCLRPLIKFVPGAKPVFAFKPPPLGRPESAHDWVFKKKKLHACMSTESYVTTFCELLDLHAA